MSDLTPVGARSGSAGPRSAAEGRREVSIAGHGLLLSPHCPCRVAHLRNGTLLVQPTRATAAGLPPVAAVALGGFAASASAEPVVGEPLPTWVYGVGGPRISLGN